MNFTPEFWLQIVVAAGAGISTYAAIRADLAQLHERTTNTKERAEEAHQRIDNMQQATINYGRRTHD